MRFIHIFNPSNEMALAADVTNYTPPKRIQQLEQQMASLPAAYARRGDVVLTDWSAATYAQLCQRAGCELVPAPWGWSKAIRHKLLRWGVPERLMPSDETLGLWRTFASRSFVIPYQQRLRAAFPLPQLLVESAEEFIGGRGEWTNERPYAVISKPEFSSSGRGICIAQPQQSVNNLPALIDRFYDKTLDFALEFFLTGAKVHFLGYSVFSAKPQGHYVENYDEEQPQLEARILQALQPLATAAAPDLPRQALQQLIRAHQTALQQLLLGRYRGPLGIDHLVAKISPQEVRIHPCLEINLRMNMGIVNILKHKKK